MQRTSLKRAAAGLAALAVTGTGLVALAPPAMAADSVVTGVTPATRPTILNDATGQDVGNLSIAFTGPAAANDTITILLDDNDVAANCATTGDSVAFSAKPTASAGATVGDPTNSASCPAGTNDKVVLTLAAGTTSPITVSGIKVSVGVAAGPGAMKATANGTLGNPAVIARIDRITPNATRYATAASVAKEKFGNCVDKAVIANGQNWPDALAANYLAGSLNAPVLLVSETALPDETKAALLAMGVGRVYPVGGTAAFSEAALNSIRALDEGACTGSDDASGKIQVEPRIAGATRYDTADLVARSQGFGGVGTLDDLSGDCTDTKQRTAILASGENYADALAAGALSYTGAITGACGDGPLPLLLTPKDSLHPATRSALIDLGIRRVVIMGGTAAISATVRNTVNALTDVEIVEISGADRQETAKLLADRMVTRGFNDRVLIARGDNFPDALAGGQLGAGGGVILLTSTTSSLGARAAAYITAQKDVTRALLLGGTTALTGAIQTSVGGAFTARSATIAP